MRALTAIEMLDVWERGQGQTPLKQALMLLAAANPGTPVETLEQYSVGRRDADLLTLREWTFGPQLASVAACPRCDERLELAFDVADIRIAGPPGTEPDEGGQRERSLAPAGALSLSVSGYEIECRPPNSLDLIAVEGSQDAEAARRRVIERCLLAARCVDQECPLDELPAEVVEAVVERMAQADPQADVQLDLACPSCAHRWLAPFDIVSFFWSELGDWALRTLRQVHLLARAYGWSQADILALSPWRRQHYIEMVNQ